jgi:hypothetical protein
MHHSAWHWQLVAACACYRSGGRGVEYDGLDAEDDVRQLLLLQSSSVRRSALLLVASNGLLTLQGLLWCGQRWQLIAACVKRLLDLPQGGAYRGNCGVAWQVGRRLCCRPVALIKDPGWLLANFEWAWFVLLLWSFVRLSVHASPRCNHQG